MSREVISTLAAGILESDRAEEDGPLGGWVAWHNAIRALGR